MFGKHVLNKITSLSRDDQLEIIKCTSNLYDFDGVEKCRENLLETCDESEVQKILEVIAHLNYLHRSNNRSKFLEIAEELKIPKDIRYLYVQDSLAVRPLRATYDYKWRIDISVPKANAILINISRGVEEPICIRLDVSMFHKLRFNIALLLKEINSLRSNQLRLKKF